MSDFTGLKNAELQLGEGWSTQEYLSDETERAFRWTSWGNSELYVDASVVQRVRIRGILSSHVKDRIVQFTVNEDPSKSERADTLERSFTVDLSSQRPSVVKLTLTTASFIPHHVLKNNDFRSLGMQIYSFVLEYRDQTTRNVSIAQVAHQQHYYDTLRKERVKVVGAQGIRADSQGALHLTFDSKRRTGKMNMDGVLSFLGHRHGWSFVLGLLQQFHGSEGSMLDGFIDSTFRWNLLASPPINERQLPYQTPWFGFMHNPVLSMPDWFTSHEMQPGSFLRSATFHASLPFCKGLYVLAKPAAEFLSGILTVPVNSLYHPTAIPDPEHMFSMERFTDNPAPSVVQVGWWCRRFRTIYDLVSPYQKVFLNPHLNNKESVDTLRRIEADRQGYSLSEEAIRSVEHRSFLSDASYDLLLSKNIVILHLYDAIANNAVIECMARATPILVNPLPCVVDYLGTDYPFYFKTVEEANKKIASRSLIQETHEYLKTSGVANKVKPETFLKDLQASSIFQSL